MLSKQRLLYFTVIHLPVYHGFLLVKLVEIFDFPIFELLGDLNAGKVLSIYFNMFSVHELLQAPQFLAF